MLLTNNDELVINANSFVQLTGSGLDYNDLKGDGYTPCYGSTVGTCRKDEVSRVYKKYYKYLCKGDPDHKLFMMSNTWGDRNQDKAVCEEFMLKEIDTAKRLGIDIVQTDDGCQLGLSGNSAIDRSGVWERFYEFDPDFWSVNTKKFPNGLPGLTQYAKDNGSEIGLWFVPDSYQDFCNWQKDTQVLLGFYKEYGFRYFKLDGINK